jgi:hypothetical protein
MIRAIELLYKSLEAHPKFGSTYIILAEIKAAVRK